VRRFAALGQKQGWDLFVMYGQTEATARMAYLPPDAAREHPEAIGVPIPGGTLTVELASEDADEGELVYRGPNVMMGYATSADDLALGRTITELRTGDIGRRTPDGLFEIVGRRSRFVKPFGLRVDLDRLERLLADAGLDAACTGDDRRLVVATTSGVRAARRIVQRATRLPAHCVRVFAVDALPRRANGKPDYGALGADARAASDAHYAADLHGTFAAVLGRESVADDDTFVSLGGDSLSYVEASICLEERLGYLPDRWHEMRVGELAGLVPQRRRFRAVETGVLLRALAVVLVVAHHALWIPYQGGPHVLLAIAGYNFARFGLAVPEHRRLRRSVATIARIAVPAAVVIAATSAFVQLPAIGRHALVATFVDEGVWSFWFIGVLLYALAGCAVLFSIPPVRRLERNWPFEFALGLFAGVTGLTYVALAIFGGSPVQEYRVQFVVWVFVLGWLVQRAVTPGQKAIVSVLAAAAILPYFDRPSRSAIVLAGALLLLWVTRVRVPTAVVPVVSAVARASLYIYLTHFEVLRRIGAAWSPGARVAVAVAFGVLAWQAVRLLSVQLRRAARRPRPAPRAHQSPSSPVRRPVPVPRPSRSHRAPSAPPRRGAGRRRTVRASR
jgi:hypothetical protein